MRNGLRKDERQAQGERRKETGRKTESKKEKVSVHKQAMADALQVIHLQKEGIWNR
jgi:hypothetical protein